MLQPETSKRKSSKVLGFYGLTLQCPMRRTYSWVSVTFKLLIATVTVARIHIWYRTSKERRVVLSYIIHLLRYFSFSFNTILFTST